MSPGIPVRFLLEVFAAYDYDFACHYIAYHRYAVYSIIHIVLYVECGARTTRTARLHDEKS
jgi:hypothetical protein